MSSAADSKPGHPSIQYDVNEGVGLIELVAAVDDPGHPFVNGGDRDKPAIRDDRGRWTRGNPGGPGSKIGARYAAFSRALVDAVSEEDVADIARQLVCQARGGNLLASKIVFDYLLKKPDSGQATISASADGIARIQLPGDMDEGAWDVFQQMHKRAVSLVRKAEVKMPLVPIPGLPPPESPDDHPSAQ